VVRKKEPNARLPTGYRRDEHRKAVNGFRLGKSLGSPPVANVDDERCRWDLNIADGTH
jgi:hypothetical protein